MLNPQQITHLSDYLYMGYYVYILQSEKDHSFYKGFTTHPSERLLQHNNGESEYTSTKTPWKLVYVEECATKRDALIRERNLKKATTEKIEQLLFHYKNIVRQFSDR